MPRLLPRVVQTLITQSPDATRVRDGLTAAVQPTLDFLNRYFQQAADGSLTLLSRLSAKAATFAGDVVVNNGNVLVYTRSPNGFVIVPTGGSPTFYCTNPQNTDAVFLVDSGGQASAVRYTSRNGFKRAYRMGMYWSNAGMPTSYATLQEPIVLPDGSRSAIMAGGVYMPFAGSVVAITAFANGGLGTGNTASFCLYKNGAATSLSVTAAGNPFLVTAGKGAYSFNANDFLQVYLKGSATIAQAFTAHIEVESDG